MPVYIKNYCCFHLNYPGILDTFQLQYLDSGLPDNYLKITTFGYKEYNTLSTIC